MAAPSLIAARRFPHPLRLRLQVLFAKAFESLADTYRIQAMDFVRRLRGRMAWKTRSTATSARSACRTRWSRRSGPGR